MRTFKIFRYLPGEEPYWQDFTVECTPDEAILTILNRIREKHDPSLAFRFSCRSAVCGSCSIQINGRPRLACKTTIRQLEGDEIRLAPLPGLPVFKDLIVDLQPYWDSFKKVMPWLEEAGNSDKMVINNKVSDLQEAICTCILCASCYSACPEAGRDRDYLGPHALMEGYRLLQDPRDNATARRLEVLAGKEGAFGCDGAFGCINACPWNVAPVKFVAKIRTAAMKVHMGLMKAEDACEYRAEALAGGNNNA